MKFHIALSITLLVVATTTQGFLLKAAIKNKLHSSLRGLKPSHSQTQSGSSQSSGSVSSSGTISSLSEPINNESFESALNTDDVPPRVTLYPYPPQHQVIYRTIRPVVRRTIYVEAPPSTYSDRAFPGLPGLPSLPSLPSLPGLPSLTNPISFLSGIKASLRNALSPQSLASPAPAALQVPAPQAYYLY